MSKSGNNAWSTGPAPDAHHAQHDWNGSEPLSTTVMTAVAEAMNEDPREMDPLYDQFDPDALDCLFTPSNRDVPLPGGHFTFTFKSHHVIVQSDGHIAVHPPQ